MRKSIGSAALAYALWGLIPIYFKAIQSVPADQILAHRFVWSFLFLILLVILRHELPAMRASTTRRTFGIYLGAGLLLAVNWGLFVWAVNNGHVLEASLGYFINPLVNVVLGVVFLRERLRPMQWIPVALASAGVLYLTISFGRLPWIALGLAFSFGFYGLVKKLAPLSPLHGLTLETGSLLLVALGYLVAVELGGAGSFGHVSPQLSLLLALSGIVTAVPLLLFAIGARQVPLTTMGLLQYTSPTLQFLTGVFLYHEAFTQARLIGFCIIWLALVLFSAESLIHVRRPLSVAPVSAD